MRRIFLSKQLEIKELDKETLGEGNETEIPLLASTAGACVHRVGSALLLFLLLFIGQDTGVMLPERHLTS